MRLPLYESKQFMVLLPSLFVLVALGIHQVQQLPPAWFGQMLALSICALVAYGSYASLQRYWTTPKSPEGLAVLAVRDRVRASDAVVSLYYSLDAAISFYLPEASLYTKPLKSSDDYLFSRSG